MKKLIATLAVALIAVTASAQITWNAKAGIGISSVLESGGSEGSKTHLVGKIGGGIEYPLTSNLSLMPSLEFAFKGAAWEYEYDTNKSFKETIDIYYLQVPVLFAYRFNLTDRLNLVAKVGPYFAFGLAGKVHDKNPSWGNESYGVFSEQVGCKRFEVGGDVGIDLEFKRWVVGVEYEIGITPLLKEEDKGFTYTMRNSAFYATVGYKF